MSLEKQREIQPQQKINFELQAENFTEVLQSSLIEAADNLKKFKVIKEFQLPEIKKALPEMSKSLILGVDGSAHTSISATNLPKILNKLYTYRQILILPSLQPPDFEPTLNELIFKKGLDIFFAKIKFNINKSE